LSGDELLGSLLNTIPWASNAVVFRRTLLDRTGGFERTLRIAEDCHLWLRMAYSGHVVPGDFSRPVAVYYRHSNSAYQPDARQRLHAIRALSAFYLWTFRQPTDNPRQHRIRQIVADYILRGVEEARREKRIRLGWLIALKSALWFPPLRFERRWYGNLARLACGR
jgi:hypothetical protein